MRKTFIYSLYVVYLIVLIIISDFLIGLLYNNITSAYAPYGKKNIDIFLGNEDIDKALREKPHPYMLWVNTPEYVNQNGIKETNNLGYRNKDDLLDISNEEGNFRILTLGGSTTWGYLLDKPEDTWSEQLQNILNSGSGDDSKKRIQVINGGLNYGTSAELLLHYMFRDRYLNPDIVIIHTGGNDIGPLIFHDYNPDYSDFRPGWDSHAHRLRKGERFLIEHSNIIKTFYAFWLRDSVALPFINKQAKSYDLEEDYYVKNATENAPFGFDRNLDLLLRNIIADGAKPILFPFVFASDEIFDDLSPESIERASYTKKIRKGSIIAFEKNKEVIIRLSEKYQLPLFDLPADSIPAEYFLDHCHLSKGGEKIKAEFIATNIRPFLK